MTVVLIVLGNVDQAVVSVANARNTSSNVAGIRRISVGG
jgi:hypothetical protein